MKIMLAAAAFSSEMSGVQRHAFNVVRCLLERPEVSAVHLVVAPWQGALVESFGFESDERLRIHLAAMERTSIARNLWYAYTLPTIAAQQAVDLVHLAYPSPVRSGMYKVPVAVTLHDLYPYEIPRNFGFVKMLFNRIILRQCLNSVDAIAGVSQITMRQLGQYLPSARHKAVCIYNCVTASQTAEDSLSVPGIGKTPFLLCVAQHRRNKNIPFLIRTFAELLKNSRIDSTMKLLVVGIRGPETRLIQSTIEHYKLHDRVILLNGLSEAELNCCYTRCEVLVTPSITEGFGLPVAEASLAGSRIVCSDIPAFREVGHERCLFVPLDNDASQGFANAITQALTQPRPAPLTLPHLSVSELGAQYLTFYRRMLTATPSATCLRSEAVERLPG